MPYIGEFHFTALRTSGTVRTIRASRRRPMSRFQSGNASMYSCTGASPSAFAICGLSPERRCGFAVFFAILPPGSERHLGVIDRAPTLRSQHPGVRNLVRGAGDVEVAELGTEVADRLRPSERFTRAPGVFHRAFKRYVLVRNVLGLHADRCATRTTQQLSFARLRSDRERDRSLVGGEP